MAFDVRRDGGFRAIDALPGPIFLANGRTMGIRFLCPNGHKLNVKADLAGKRASCPECGAKLVVPAAGDQPKAVAPRQSSSILPTPPSGVWYLRTAGGQQLGPATEDAIQRVDCRRARDRRFARLARRLGRVEARA